MNLVAAKNQPKGPVHQCSGPDLGHPKAFTGLCAPPVSRARGVFLLTLALLLLLPCSGLAQPGYSVMLAWDPSPSPEVTTYKLYRGVVSATYDYTVITGNTTNFTVTGLAQGTTYFFVCTAMDAVGSESDYSNEVEYTVAPNTPPVISAIPDQSIDQDASTGPLPFTLADAETPAAGLLLRASCSEPSLVPQENIVFGGADAERTVTVTPAPGQLGTATIIITVSDQEATSSTSFLLTIHPPPPPPNTPPSISSIADQRMDQDAGNLPILFSIGDAETPAAGLVVTAASSNISLVPDANISLAGTGTERTVTVAPAAGQAGTATITLIVSDGSLSATSVFLLTVDPLPVVALTSPENAATYQDSANIPLTAQVTTNGHSILKVQFYNGDALLNETATPPYAWTWSSVPAGTYRLVASAVYDSGKIVTSVPVTVTVRPAPTLPLPWLTVDIGTVTIPGSASAAEGIFTVSGAGNIGGKADNFRYVHQSLTDDGEIRCRLLSAQNTGENGRIGAMIRESLTSKSRHVFLGITPAGTCEWQCRAKTGAASVVVTGGLFGPPSLYLRLVRSGDRVDGWISQDNVNWTSAGSTTVRMARAIYIGLVVGSGTQTELNTSTFAQVEVVP